LQNESESGHPTQDFDAPMAQIVSSVQTTLWNSPDQLATVLRWLTFLLLFVAAAFGAAIYCVNDRIGTLTADKIISQGGELKSRQATVDQQARMLTEQTDTIARLNDDLQSERSKAAQLAQAAAAERVVADDFNYGGRHRLKTGNGASELISGSETTVFETIQRLYAIKDWVQLKVVCESEIKVTPKWLTPYMFSGVASANMGDLKSAIDRLEYVVANAGDDPSYADASRVLAEVKAAQLLPKKRKAS
jgi:hypothetical protein